MSVRCGWVSEDPLYRAYHDEEWGVPVRDEHRLFEYLLLEGAQAGLSWFTVLKKRAHYREVFEGFDPERVARFDEARKAALLADPGIIRNRAKVDAAVINARAWLAMREEGIDPVDWLWAFVGGQPVVNSPRTLADVPASTPVSDAMSKALRARGFKFVGSTICYAFMQAVGMVDDHTVDCFRHGRAVAGDDVLIHRC
ncbi:DNA-3-methyladenine glycosylase I [Thauera sp. CAU 1555]|jgi:DNA-3-methyladenine glycosylase I|uniref:DNA-3-methyladenine glycosylase I n=1 Tax=Thauera sedimentorum TaxID=2767595 RepID=A0ABR9BFE3_9RHOO|nr:DNA-3-methyladenine glycosylase I [Thauera sedimentorum]MBC9073266.1 DNA-3-methyladenine glycosylase I [Thauera sedimentorum]MBD8504185.1 DNA-3-methyladenine glycosylase I [Thauera sedimentorum]